MYVPEEFSNHEARNLIGGCFGPKVQHSEVWYIFFLDWAQSPSDAVTKRTRTCTWFDVVLCSVRYSVRCRCSPGSTSWKMGHQEKGLVMLGLESVRYGIDMFQLHSQDSMFYALMHSLTHFCLTWKFFANSHSFFFGQFREVTIVLCLCLKIKIFFLRRSIKNASCVKYLLKERIKM